MTIAETTQELNPRVAAVFTGLIEELARLIREQRITFEEYRQIVGFLDEMGRQGEVPLFLDVFVSVTVDDTNYASNGGTESNVEGPFYIPGAPLLQQRPYELPRRDKEPGDVLFLSGIVRSTNGTALADAMLDMWQADAEGKYSHFDPELPAYNLRGRFKTDAEGRFEVRTTAPSAYEIPKAGPTGRYLAALGRHAFRPAHFHFKLSHPDHEPLTTQVYFDGDPLLESDVVGAVKQSLVVKVDRHEAEDDPAKKGLSVPYYTCSFDFILQPRVNR